MRLKSRVAELKQQFKVSLAKYVGMFLHDCSYNKRFIFKNTIFRIPKNHIMASTPSSCLDSSFSVEGLSNLNCLQGW